MNEELTICRYAETTIHKLWINYKQKFDLWFRSALLQYAYNKVLLLLLIGNFFFILIAAPTVRHCYHTCASICLI